MTPVPLDGGWLPTSWFVPRVTSASGLFSPMPTPTTPPCAPSPAETEAATSGCFSGGCWLGAGGEPPPSCAPPAAPPGCAPPASEPFDPVEPEAAELALGFAGAEPAAEGGELAAGFPVTARFWPCPEAAEGAEAGAACSAAAAPEPASAGTPDPGPDTDGPAGASAGTDGAPVVAVEALSSPRSAMRETATPLATSTTATDADASHTYAPLSFRSINEMTPDPPARCLQPEGNTALGARV